MFSAQRSEKGFTSVLVLVVVAIALIVLSFYLGYQKSSKNVVQTLPSQSVAQTSQEVTNPDDARQQLGNCTSDECLFLKSSNSTIYGYTKVSGYYKAEKGSNGPYETNCDALVVTNSNSEFAKFYIKATKENNNPPMLDSNGNLIFVFNLDGIDPKFKQLIINSKPTNPVSLILGIPEVMRSMDSPGCYSPATVLSAS